MFKNPFRNPTPDEFAQLTLEKAKMDLLVALEWLEHYESIVGFKQKLIARLEETVNAKKSTKEGNTSSSITSNISIPPI